MRPGASFAVSLDNPVRRRTTALQNGLDCWRKVLVALRMVFRSACSLAIGTQDMSALRVCPSDQMRFELCSCRKPCTDAVWLLDTLLFDSNIAASLLLQECAVLCPLSLLASALLRPAGDRNARSKDTRMPHIVVPSHLSCSGHGRSHGRCPHRIRCICAFCSHQPAISLSLLDSSACLLSSET